MVVLVPCSPAGTHLPHVWSSLSGGVTGPKGRFRCKQDTFRDLIASGQISIIPKPECFGDFGEVPLFFTTI